MKKIGLLINTLIGSGVEQIVLNFAETFAKFGHEVYIILIKDLIEHRINPASYTIHTLRRNGRLSKYKFINKILLAQRLKKVVATIESNAKPFDLFISNAEDMDLIAKKANTSLPLALIGNTHTPSNKQYLEELKHLIKELDIKDKIIFPSFQKNPYPWIKNAELFVMSSNSEGLPLVLVEALILGTKIVSTDCPTGPSEVLIDELREFLSPIHDVENLAENIRKALKSYPAIEDKYIYKFKAENSINQYLNLEKQYNE